MRLYEATVVGTLRSQQAIWRSNWCTEQDSAPADGAWHLALGLGVDPADPTDPVANSILEAFINSAIGQAVVTEITVRNIYNVNDFITVPVDGANWIGQRSGGLYMPNFVNAKWYSSRVRQDIRRGFASTWGIMEANVDDSDNVTGAALTGPMASWASRMSADVTVVHDVIYTVTFRNCIVKKERYAVPNSSPVRYAYRYYLPEDEETQMANLAIQPTWSIANKVTSTVSRKIGKGA